MGSYKTLTGGIRQADNIDEAKSTGIESALNWQVTDWLTSFINHTYQDTEDKETKDELDYMARNKSKFGLRVDKKIGAWTLKGSVTEIYVGRRHYQDW